MKEFAKVLLASILIIIIIPFSIELLVRVHFRMSNGEWPVTMNSAIEEAMKSSKSLYIEHGILPFVLNPGISTRYMDTSLHINSCGFRGNELAPSSSLRVLVVGGSTTFDTGVTDDEATWCMQLQKALQSAYPGLEVINAGLPVYCLWGNYVKYILYDHHVRPDIVLVFQGINDLTPWWAKAFSGLLREDYWGYRGVTSREWSGVEGRFSPQPHRGKLMEWMSRSVLITGAHNKRGGDGNMFADKELASTSEQAVPDSQLEKNLAILRYFVTSLRAEGVIPVFVPQGLGAPTRKAVPSNYPVWISSLDKLNDAYLGLCREMGVTTIDLRGEITGWDDAYFQDFLHFSDRGAREFASGIAGHLSAEAAIQEKYRFYQANPPVRPVKIDVLGRNLPM